MPCAKAQQYNPGRERANKQSQLSAVDAMAKVYPGSHGMGRKGTSAQKQAVRECFQKKLSLREEKGLQQVALPFREPQVYSVARAWVLRSSYGGEEAGEIGRRQVFSGWQCFLWHLEGNKKHWQMEWASLVAQVVKNLPAMQETPVQFLGQEAPLEKE